MKSLSALALTVITVSVSGLPAMAGTATNRTEWGHSTNTRNRKEIGVFNRKSEFNFEYGRHGNALEIVQKNEFTADGDILSGYVKGKKLGFFSGKEYGLVGTTADDFSAVGIHTYTRDKYSYDLTANGSNSSHEFGVFVESDKDVTTIEWDQHEVSSGTMATDLGL